MGKQQRPANPSHDVSTWKQVVVGTDEFTPTARRSRTTLWIAIVVALALGAGLAIALVR
jgi:hypothetical protein